MVLPPLAVEVNNFPVLVHNETSKDLFIPAGAVIAHVFATDTVTVAQGSQTTKEFISQLCVSHCNCLELYRCASVIAR